MHHEIGERVRDVGRATLLSRASTPGRGGGPTRRRGCAWTRATATACVERPRRAVDMPRIRSRSEERAEKDRTLGWRAQRWVVERTHFWMNRSRHLLVRWEKKAENDLAFVHLVCAQLVFSRTPVSGSGFRQARTWPPSRSGRCQQSKHRVSGHRELFRFARPSASACSGHGWLTSQSFARQA